MRSTAQREASATTTPIASGDVIGAPTAEMRRVVVIDPHPIFRRGLVSCLETLEGVDAVASAGSVAEARERELVDGASLLLIDHGMPDVHDYLEEVVGRTGVRVVVCSDCESGELLRASISAGAMGFLCKRTLRPSTLRAALLAAAGGNGILPPGMLSSLSGLGTARLPRPEEAAESPAEATPSPAGPPRETASPLTEREHQVLALIADGEPTREVARRLSYSERTVKNVLHDIVVKLGVRSRAQAVAHAVRHGLI